jgi:ribose 5-phosphate isomerase B
VKIVIGSDHGGFELKEELKAFLSEQNISVEDLGTQNAESVDYPDYAAKVAERIAKGDADAGVLVCGTGIGMCMTANKFKGIRAAVLTTEFEAEMAKAHNNANVICLGGRVLDAGAAKNLTAIWLKTEYEGGRHDRRLAKIAELEKSW